MRDILDQLQREQNDRCATLDFHRGFADALARVRNALEAANVPPWLDDPVMILHYRTLVEAGFRPVDDRMPSARWIAPDDEPLTTEQMVAVANLQEYGFGPVAAT